MNQVFSSINKCFSNQSYIDVQESVLIISAGSLQLNFQYEFSVQLTNRRNLSLQTAAYALVYIQHSNVPMIAIRYLIILLYPHKL